jgi:magnesium chelatase family protein
MAIRPVRTPHHSSSSPALIGGGAIPQPGEVSLAHHGVLFLDEFPEFARTTLEMIRQPLEDGCVTIPRVHSTLKFPARIMLVAAMNPCPCGYLTDPRRKCKCTPILIERYLSRISGPLIDRIDIHIEVPPVPYRQLRAEGPAAEGLTSSQMREQVVRAREVQRERFGHSRQQATGNRQQGTDNWQLAAGDGQDAVSPSSPGPEDAKTEIRSRRSGGSTTTNASMSPRQVRQFCKLDAAGETLLKQAMTELGLSARAHDKILRVARTIADLEGCQSIQAHQLAEAVQYRRLDRKL